MFKTKNYNWVKIASSVTELPFSDDGLTTVNLEGKQVCIAKFNNEILGCAASCPHAGGKLADGYVDALGNIVCPVHRYKFSLKQGRNVTGEGYFLKTYPIDMREDGIYIGIEE